MKVLLNQQPVDGNGSVSDALKNLPREENEKPVDTKPLENTATDWEDDDETAKPSVEPKQVEEPNNETPNTPNVDIPEDVRGEDFEKILKGETPSSTPSTATNGQPAKRDYTIFREEDRAWAEKLPNAAFDAVKRRLPELYNAANRAEELEKRLQQNNIPESWHQHPNAYLLAPEFQTKQTLYKRAEFEQKHFDKQAIDVENGAETYKMLKGYDAETGEPVFEDVPVPAGTSTGVRNQLLQYSMRSAAVRDGAINELHHLKQNFAQRFESTAGELKQAEKAYFPFFETPTPEHQKLMTEIKAKIPAIYHDHPITPYTVKLGALVRLLSAKLKDTLAQQGTTQARVAQNLRAQDETSRIPAGAVAKGKTVGDVLATWEDEE